MVKKENLTQEIQKNKKLIENLKLQLPVILDKLDFENQGDFSDFSFGMTNEDVPLSLIKLEHKTNLVLKLIKDNKFEKIVFKGEHKIYLPKEKSR